MKTCELCRFTLEDPAIVGEFMSTAGLDAHKYCLYSASGLMQRGADDEGLNGFMPADIRAEARRGSRQKCHYCKKPYASIGCCKPKCYRSFHLSCGVENGAGNEFINTYNSYCHTHNRKEKHRPRNDDLCHICHDHMWPTKSRDFDNTNMLLVPCCRSGWFHKSCLQRFAQTAGYFYKCPLCNDTSTFREKLQYRGIFIPDQDAAWELEQDAYAELLERPSQCSAAGCHHPKQNIRSNKLIVCNTCGAVAVHTKCLPKEATGWTRKTRTFDCDDCKKLLSNYKRRDEQRVINDTTDDEEYIDVCNWSETGDEVPKVAENSSRNQQPIQREQGINNIITDDDGRAQMPRECLGMSDNDEDDRIRQSKKRAQSLIIKDEDEQALIDDRNNNNMPQETSPIVNRANQALGRSLNIGRHEKRSTNHHQEKPKLQNDLTASEAGVKESRKRKSYFVPLKDEPNIRQDMQTSFIAHRTRRKSILIDATEKDETKAKATQMEISIERLTAPDPGSTDQAKWEDMSKTSNEMYMSDSSIPPRKRVSKRALRLSSSERESDVERHEPAPKLQKSAAKLVTTMYSNRIERFTSTVSKSSSDSYITPYLYVKRGWQNSYSESSSGESLVSWNGKGNTERPSSSSCSYSRANMGLRRSSRISSRSSICSTESRECGSSAHVSRQMNEKAKQQCQPNSRKH